MTSLFSVICMFTVFCIAGQKCPDQSSCPSSCTCFCDGNVKSVVCENGFPYIIDKSYRNLRTFSLQNAIIFKDFKEAITIKQIRKSKIKASEVKVENFIVENVNMERGIWFWRMDLFKVWPKFITMKDVDLNALGQVFTLLPDNVEGVFMKSLKPAFIPKDIASAKTRSFSLIESNLKGIRMNAYNKIFTIANNSFNYFPALTRLKLNDNHLKVISWELVKPIWKTLIEFSISNNLLVCEEHCWIHKEETFPHPQMFDMATCLTSNRLNKSLYELKCK
ncbi:hypothetical protein B4U79_17896 [Dinothrombium tinctorium]|uniref:Uncharacterized protein n=1 Tax=Dinothrombium tinctorium TaxID=1965070 RepID=A0A443RKP7_9ACAR|nr:hypothetical protein B4U79_17896 [Dinothrombium tinctorium]